jgi:hypothetical protein
VYNIYDPYKKKTLKKRELNVKADDGQVDVVLELR